MSTPGGEQPDFNPEFSEFDLSADDMMPAEDSTLSDFPADDLEPPSAPPDEPQPTEVFNPESLETSADDLEPPSAPPDELMPTEIFGAESPETPADTGGEPAAFSDDAGLLAAGLAATVAGEAAQPAIEAPKKGKKAKAPKQKKEKKQKESTGEGLFARLQKTSPYIVLLGLSLLALLIAVLCLVIELSRYNFDLKAEEARQRSAMAPAAHSAPAMIKAAA